MAPTDEDLSHPAYFRRQKKTGVSATLNPEDVGQPGCTDAERGRFFSILDGGNLVDAYRHLYGSKKNDGMTWRGTQIGKFGDKGMRIDHCIVSRTLVSGIKSVEILGHAKGRSGFMTSDHCPLLIVCSGTLDKEFPDAQALPLPSRTQLADDASAEAT